MPTNGSMMQNLAESFLLWRKHCQHRIQPTGITVKQAFVLRMVAAAELNPSRVADLLFSDRATTSAILQTMVRRGWIQRRRDSRNRKYVRISATSEGLSKLAEVDAHLRNLPEPEDPFSCFTDSERRDFSRLIAKLRKRMDELPDQRIEGVNA